jgi:hypothetical protein
MTRTLLCTPGSGDGSSPDPGSPLTAAGLRLIRGGVVLLSLLLLLLLPPPPLAAQLPPDEEWRTLDTENFRVHFPARVEQLARQAAERGERAWALLEEVFLEPGGGRVDLVVTDHLDISNGFAGVTPWRRIVVYAAPPVDGSGLSYYDDWMELVVTHELAHIFHLDVAGRGGRALRGVLGRAPGVWPIFPNRGLPTWVIEGLAVHYESSLTDAGRIRGTFHDMVIRTAALTGTLETLDQIGGRSPVWPAGQRPYIYGSLFFSHLASKAGPGSIARFARAVGGQWIPYRIDAASEEAFGAPFSQLYEEWRQEVMASAGEKADSLAALHPLTVGEAVTMEARTAVNSAFGPGGELAYARSDGRNDSQLRLLGASGEEVGSMRTNGVASFSWLPDGGLLVAQLESLGPYRLHGDLTVRSAAGDERRLTRGARLSFPDVAPDGHVAVAVQEGEGTNRLVLVDLVGGGILPLGDLRLDEHWAYPRYSPDGRWIAASRWRPGARFDLVLLHPDGSEAWVVTDDRAVDTTPAWSPDGRWLLWSSDRTGIPNLFAVEVDPATGAPGPVRQVTHVLEGASHPAVHPEAGTLVYSRYGPTGWDLERIPFDPALFFDPLPMDPRFLEGGERAARSYSASIPGPHRSYNPIPSMLPRWWSPRFGEASTVRGVEVVGPRFGLALEGRDLVDRHSWAGEVLVDPVDGRWEGGLGWRWAGLGLPILGISGGQSWGGGGAVLGRRQVEGVEVLDTLYVAEREQSLGATATLIRARARSSTSLTLGGRAIRETLVLQDASGGPAEGYRLTRPTRSLGEVRGGLAFSTVRGYSFSNGPEDGVSLSLQARRRWEPGVADSARGVPGLDRGFHEAVGAVRLFRGLGGPGYADWVLALRGSGGVGSGPGAGSFFFDVGGASGDTEGLLGLGVVGAGGVFFPVRGYPEGVRSGRYAWTGSAELRFPLALIHRGLGPALLHFDRLSGALFFDAGNAWGTTPGGPANPMGDPILSTGAELILRTTPFWLSPLDLRLGGALPLVEGDGPRVYLRLGRSF